MKRVLLLAGACAFCFAPAFAQTQPPQGATPPAPATPPAQAAPAPAPSPQPAPSPAATNTSAPSTQDFVNQAAISGMFEIRSSEVALHKHVRPDRDFALHMVHDHERFAAQLRELVKSGQVKADMPTKLDSEHQQMLDQLRKESGKTFDNDYDQMQLKGHQEAVALFQSYAQNGDDPALKHWAAQTLPQLQQHLAMAQKLS